MRKFVILIAALLIVSCTKRDEQPAQNLDSSSLPGITSGAPIALDSTDIVVDRSRMRTPEHQQRLARFEPLTIVEIYRDFRPLRRSDLTQGELNSFLKQKGISFEELQAILAEGDALGWQKADTTSTRK